MNADNDYIIYNDSIEYTDSLFEVKENGKYKFIGDNKDIRLVMKNHYVNDRDIISKNVISINDEWCRVDVHRKYINSDDWKIEEYQMAENDILYIDWEGNILNFSHEHIYFIRVDNMNEIDEILTLPKVFEREFILDFIDTDDKKNEELLHYAWLYSSMIMDEKEIIEKFMTNTYGEDWSEYSLNKHYEEEWSNLLESQIYEDNDNYLESLGYKIN